MDCGFTYEQALQTCEIYVGGGGMLQHIKLIQAENLSNLQFFFMWSERDDDFATNKVLHIYSQIWGFIFIHISHGRNLEGSVRSQVCN